MSLTDYWTANIGCNLSIITKVQVVENGLELLILCFCTKEMTNQVTYSINFIPVFIFLICLDIYNNKSWSICSGA